MGVVDAPADPPRKSIRKVILDLFPWLARVGLTPAGALKIRSAAGRTELEGGGPAAARVGDVAGFEFLEVTTGGGNVVAVALYRSAANGAASKWSLVATGASPPVDGATVGTPITITTGSGKVQIG